ncbi:MAG: DUF1223 domain-containing protein [Flavobacterium sp.]|uniref:DUF1223 domain-containing protein n=1 Tax=Flavobacterium sp. TaxID=239 RepID=UPI003263BEFB
MKKTAKLLFLLLFFMLTACGQSNSKTNSKTNGIVVLELFTSQGCSSCPPADKILASYVLKNNPKIIPLAFHVDYWNYLGWKDPFSKAEFSNRQREYAKNFDSYSVYTPQLIVNGKHEIVGSNESGVEKLVNKELNLNNDVSLEITSATISGNKLLVNWKTNSGEKNVTINIALVKKNEFVQIKRGENSGLKQTSYNIVFDFKEQTLDANTKNQIAFDFKDTWQSDDFIVVAYLQKNHSGVIETACQTEIK